MSFSIAKIFIGCAASLGAILLVTESDLRLPGDHTGYAPAQPIAYSHRLHAGELGIDCLYCHYGARTGAVAGIPPASICMNCHATVTAGYDALQTERELAAKEKREPRPVVSAELQKLYGALGLDQKLERDPRKELRPIEWVRVHDLPDFVYFDHRIHVARGIGCQTCHGPVETMERVRQVSSLSMGWCIDCHRINRSEARGALPAGSGHPRVGNHVTTDCIACHF